MTDNELALLIIKRYKERYPNHDWKDLLNPPYTIMNAFSWNNTEEGWLFWSNIHSRLGYNLSNFLKENLYYSNKNNFILLQIFV